jgi:tetratricopeptide (TPR) repeat protein
MTAETPTAPESTSAGEGFKRMTAILIASVTIVAAIAAFLQTDAGGRAVQANREAQRYAIEALGARASGQSEVDYGWYGAAQTWYALNTQALTADQQENADAAARFRAVRDRIAKLSPLMADPYFNPESGLYPDRYGYEVDVFLERATDLTERYTASAQLNNAWNDKANTYIVHLTLLAVSLALYGLSTTPDDWTRWIFVAAGSAIVATTIGWMAITIVRPVDSISGEAISRYASGYGLAWRGRTADAISAFDEAIQLEPGYANAYYERGNSHFTLVYESIGTDPKAAEEQLRLAAADFESARAAGKDDGSVNWNLGWAYYLLGFFEESATASERAVTFDASLFPVRCNLGVTLLADGKIDEARAQYAEAIRIVTARVTEARAAEKAPPSSLWLYLNSCAADVESLSHRLDDQPRAWTQAPPRDLVADTPEVRAEVQRLIGEIRSMLVALEYTGEAPGERPTANISAFRFGVHRTDEAGSFVYDDDGLPIYDSVPDGIFASGTKKVGILYDYQGVARGQKEIWKVYRNGTEDPSLRVTAEWDLEESGSAVKPISYAFSEAFVLSSGEYTIELYLDNYLVQRGTFIIE